jgi:hypothetical protein
MNPLSSKRASIRSASRRRQSRTCRHLVAARSARKRLATKTGATTTLSGSSETNPRILRGIETKITEANPRAKTKVKRLPRPRKNAAARPNIERHLDHIGTWSILHLSSARPGEPFRVRCCRTLHISSRLDRLTNEARSDDAPEAGSRSQPITRSFATYRGERSARIERVLKSGPVPTDTLSI